MLELMKKVLLVGLLAAMLWTVAGCRMSGSKQWGEDTKKKLESQP
jgi:predicted small lipoprotein YifL